MVEFSEDDLDAEEKQEQKRVQADYNIESYPSDFGILLFIETNCLKVLKSCEIDEIAEIDISGQAW